jgi:hypothetical protein
MEENKKTPDQLSVNDLLNEFSVPQDARPGENPTTYKRRKEHEEREQILKNANNLKNQ